MHPTRDFDLLRSNKLWIIRHGVYNPSFELTDQQYCYAVINSKSDFIGTEKDKWVFKKDKEWNGKYAIITINNLKGEKIGSLTFNEMKHMLLKINNGFEASFVKKESLFSFLSPAYEWTNSNHGDIITIEESAWHLKKMFKITTNNNYINTNPYLLPLMILYSVSFLLTVRGFDTPTGLDQ